MSVLKLFADLVPNLNFCYFIGGDKLEYDLERIREKGANVIVATPGRLFDLAIEKSALCFRKLEMLVMDEADKLLMQGHEIHLSSILQMMPKLRRTGLFSATMPSSLKNFIKIGMRNPYYVEVRSDHGDIFSTLKGNATIETEGITIQSFDLAISDSVDKQVKEITELPAGLKNYHLTVEHQARKLPSLLAFLSTLKSSRIIVFFATCASVDFHFPFLKLLLPAGSHIAKLHGKIDQKRRTKIYQEFRSHDKHIDANSLLLTTDLAARGIDIPEVDWIVQFDPPQWSD